MTPCRNSRNILPETEALDSDSSDDEDAAELCEFWQNLRRLKVQAILATSADGHSRHSREPASASAAQRASDCRGGAWLEEDSDGRSTSSASRAMQPATLPSPTQQASKVAVEKRSTVELLRREARESRGALSLCPPRALRPGESPPMRLCRGGVGTGLGLWRCPAEVTLQVLCFIQSSDICELILTCKTTRAACSIHTSAGWFLVLPHLILSSNAKIASAQLKRVWLPHTLWLEGRDLDAAACQTLLKGLECTGAKAARALRTLDLRNTRNCSASSVVAVARSCRSLCSLNLSRTRLRDLGASHLLGSLIFDPLTGSRSPHLTLRVLMLDDNRLSAAVGKQLARVVQETPLEVLGLACNELGDEGVEAIAEAFTGEMEGGCHRPTSDDAPSVRLTRLDVSRNRIGANGMRSLIGALKFNRTLRSLEMGGNERIGPGLAASSVCAGCIASSLQVAKGLEELHLWKCGLADAAYNLISASLPPNIAVANLATNNFSSTVRTFILEARCGVIRL